MAYQNVGKPRIFIDYYQYSAAIGNISYWGEYNATTLSPQHQGIFMNPLLPATMSNYNGGTRHYHFVSFMYGMNFYAMLGHNMGGVPVGPAIQYSGENIGGNDIWLNNIGGTHQSEEIMNMDFSTTPGAGANNRYGTPRYNGFSIWKFPEITADMAKVTLEHPDEEIGTQDVQIHDHFSYSADGMYPDPLDGSAIGTYVSGFTPVCGRIYEFEHAPDVKVTMERQFDGTKKQKTVGGADISNTTFTGPPNWPLSGNPWTLTEASPGVTPEPVKASRIGRRVWKLKFSMLSDRVEGGNGVMSINELSTPFGVDTSDGAGYANTDWSNDGVQDYFVKDLWTDDSFMGCVFAKTMGFTLPFIFQPDSNNNSPDQFAICKIDNKSLRIKQSSFKKYDISLTIREVW